MTPTNEEVNRPGCLVVERPTERERGIQSEKWTGQDGDVDKGTKIESQRGIG